MNPNPNIPSASGKVQTFEVVSCPSSEPGHGFTGLQYRGECPNSRFISSKLPEYPLNFLLRFDSTVHFDKVVLESEDHHSPHKIAFYTGTCLLSGLLPSTSWNLAGRWEHPLERGRRAIDLFGSGNVLKVQVLEGPSRSGHNIYRQIVFKQLQVFGVSQGLTRQEQFFLSKPSQARKDEDDLHWRISQGIARNRDRVAHLQNARIDRLLIENGFNVLTRATQKEARKQIIREWWEKEGATNPGFSQDPQVEEIFFELGVYKMDKQCRRTLDFLEKLKQNMIQREEFSSVQRLNEDMVRVREWGREIYRLQVLLEKAILQDRFGYAEALKKKVHELRDLKFKIDIFYETPLFLEMIKLEFHRADLVNQLGQQKNRIQKEIEGKMNNLQKLPIQRAISFDQKPKKRTIVKKKPIQKENTLKRNKSQKTKKVEVPEKEKIFKKRSNSQMDSILRREISKLGGRDTNYMDWIQVETLRMLHERGILKIFGAKLWSSVHSEDWRVRHAAARSVREYLSSFDEQKFGQTFPEKSRDALFRASLFFCRMIMGDKINKVFDESHEILRLAHKSPIFNPEVTTRVWTASVTPVLPFLVTRCEQLNSREKSLSRKTLRNIFSLPSTKMTPILEVILAEVTKSEADFEMFIRKEKARVLSGRLDILSDLIQVADKQKFLKGLRKPTRRLENGSSYSFSVNVNTPKSSHKPSRNRLHSNYSRMLRSVSNKDVRGNASERNLIHERFLLPCLSHAHPEVRKKASALIEDLHQN